MYRVLSLFAGIGGFDLGLERTGGFRTVAFCEIDPFCRKVLAKHWPSVPCYEDVRTLTAERLAADGIDVDCIVGGFPCQDISFAGKGAGLGGERSGLWSEYARLIGELRPAIVIVENVSALLTRGLDAVLGTLASLGYDAEWHCIPAAYVGAPHRRDRIWIVCHPHGQGKPDLAFHGKAPGVRGVVADAACELLDGRGEPGARGATEPANRSGAMADANCARLAQREMHAGSRGETFSPSEGQVSPLGSDAIGVADAARVGPNNGWGVEFSEGREGPRGFGHWSTEPDVGRVAHGVPARVDRLRSLGNAVVPQVVEMIGRAILASDAQRIAA